MLIIQWKFLNQNIFILISKLIIIFLSEIELKTKLHFLIFNKINTIIIIYLNQIFL